MSESASRFLVLDKGDTSDKRRNARGSQCFLCCGEKKCYCRTESHPSQSLSRSSHNLSTTESPNTAAIIEGKCVSTGQRQFPDIVVARSPTLGQGWILPTGIERRLGLVVPRGVRPGMR